MIAALGAPAWPTPPPRPAQAPAPAAPALELRVIESTPVRLPLAETRPRPAEPTALPEEAWLRSLGTAVGTRLVQLGLIFAAVLIITLAMSLVAQAVR